MKTKAQKLLGNKKPASLEDLKQQYINTKNASGKKLLLELIKKRDPKFKG